MWAAITDGERYPEWWPGVQQAKVLGPDPTVYVGQVTQLAVRGALPYTRRFQTEVIDRDAPRRLVVRSSGDLSGRGEWNLTSMEAGTRVTYRWEVTLVPALVSSSACRARGACWRATPTG